MKRICLIVFFCLCTLFPIMAGTTARPYGSKNDNVVHVNGSNCADNYGGINVEVYSEKTTTEYIYVTVEVLFENRVVTTVTITISKGKNSGYTKLCLSPNKCYQFNISRTSVS